MPATFLALLAILGLAGADLIGNYPRPGAAAMCAGSPRQSCRMLCRPTVCPSGQCAMRQGDCCKMKCQAPSSAPAVDACSANSDCPSDAWCRVGTCTDYRTEGQSCGGYTPAQYQTRCATGLNCKNTNSMIADAGGKCADPTKRPVCTNGQVYTTCGTACPPTCGQSTTMMCTMQCVEGCQCPRGSKLDKSTKSCTKSCPAAAGACQNGGTHHSAGIGFEAGCVCPPNFTGELCELAVDGH